MGPFALNEHHLNYPPLSSPLNNHEQKVEGEHVVVASSKQEGTTMTREEREIVVATSNEEEATAVARGEVDHSKGRQRGR